MNCTESPHSHLEDVLKALSLTWKMNCTESPHSHLEASEDDQQHEAGYDVVDEVPGEGGHPEGKGPHPTDNL